MGSSIRRQLPISYGILALLTATSLGAVLLFVLRGYYTRLEQLYLEQNATAVATLIEPLLEADQPASLAFSENLVQSQANTLSFLTQTKIEIFDQDGRLVVESGDPMDLQAVTTVSLEVATEEGMQTFQQTMDAMDPDAVTSVVIVDSDSGRVEQSTNVRGDFAGLGLPEGVFAPFTFGQPPTVFGLGGLGDPNLRSDEMLERVLDTPNGRPLGAVRLSQGPAFGQSILTTVTWGLVLAGGAAVALAAWLGWVISRRLTDPIRDLVQVTRGMAEGDLSVRARLEGPDELQELSRAFNTMTGRVGSTIDALRQFVADAAHELNTPLTALRTNLDLIARALPDEPNLARAIDQTDRLQTLAENLLSLSRLESGENGAVDQPVDLIRFLSERKETYATRLDQAGLQFQLDLPETLPQVRGDTAHLDRVMANLMDNAIKFTPAGGRVDLEADEAPGWVIMRVRDTGIGIPPEDLDFIFQRFHRGRNTAQFQGSGLGLAIVKRIIDLHRGRIHVKTSQEGSVFEVRLPADRSMELF